MTGGLNTMQPRGSVAHVDDAILSQLRDQIAASDRTRRRIAEESGISESRLSKLMNGRAGLSLAAVENLLDGLNLEVKVVPRKGGRR